MVRIQAVGGPTAILEVGGLRLLTDPTFDPPGDYPRPDGPTLAEPRRPPSPGGRRAASGTISMRTTGPVRPRIPGPGPGDADDAEQLGTADP